jgi:hypothetical protein
MVLVYERMGTHSLDIGDENFRHSFRVKYKEFRVQEKVASMLELKGALKVLF